MVFAVVFAVLGLTPSLSWIPEAPLLIVAFVVPVGGLLIAGYRGGLGAGTLAGAMTGLAGGLAYLAYGKSFVNVPVGLAAGVLAGAVLGWVGGRLESAHRAARQGGDDAMLRYLRWAYTGWLGLIVAAIVLQLYLAGYGVFAFNGLNGFGAHFLVGDLIGIAILIAVGLAFAARVPWRITGMNGVLLLLMVIQFLLAHTGIAALSALHVVNGVAIFGLAGRLTWEVAHLPKPAEMPATPATPSPTTT